METLKLAAPDRPQALYRYTVRGASPFPHDMLRYDSAWPRDSRSISSMEQMFQTYSTEPGEVNLASYDEPTVERWRSFGWTVD